MWKKPFLVLSILLVLAIVAWQFFKPVAPLQVESVTPIVQSLSTTLELNSVVINNQIVTITALLDGEIGKIAAREGDSVKKGHALALLDNQQAQSLLNKAQANLDNKKQQIESSSRSFSRIKDLSAVGNASKQDLDNALDALRNSEAALIIAEADITLAELQIQNSTVRAPFDGIVTEQFAESGQWVEAGTPMFKLVAKDGYLIEAQVDASDWTSVTLQQTVTLSTESAADMTWQSSVSWISSTVANSDSEAKSVAIRFPLGADSPPLLLGQEVDAELILEQIPDALTLPLSTMVESAPNEYGVFVFKNNKAMWVPVEVGLQNSTHAQITSGLSEKDQVIVAGGLPLQNGTPVEL